ncbi:hypothetical protein [uncultured Brevundimonas sp.]|uniref:hypothetical protein n=1 Tax=uncultured Brevundimonas sp. TaxID=213418 RepID=UPI00260D2865|nr:hypothetical protein [uncultured Brevundimonas sp.]
MPLILRLAAALDMLALCCERFFPSLRGLLPIGGDHFTQLGLLTILASLLLEYAEISRRTLRVSRPVVPARPADDASEANDNAQAAPPSNEDEAASRAIRGDQFPR